MIVSLIAALSTQRIIGGENTIPWRMPADLAWFKRNTWNKPVIIGRKTFESIGRKLPKRHNIVLSSYSRKNKPELTWVDSLDAALFAAGNVEEVMVIGGGCIYRQLLKRANRMYLTHINAKATGDIYFPEYKLAEWKTSFSESHNADELNAHSYYFEILERL